MLSCYNGGMANSNMGTRAVLRSGEQKSILGVIRDRLSIREMAFLCNCSERTIRDWQREKFHINFNALIKLCKNAKLPLPRDIKIRKAYWYTSKGATLGGKATLLKYGRIGGDPEYRKQRWLSWWERKGKFEKHPIINRPLAVTLPKKSKGLAEFVGIMLGDGGMTKRQMTITLHRVDDKEYAQFIRRLIEKLFNVKARVYCCKKANADSIVISRSSLVRYFVEKIGLHIGNKIEQQVDIPLWIKQNRIFMIACVRGLIDTDGCIFTHRYKVNGKEYVYKKLAFTSRSEPLRQSVYCMLHALGLKVRLTSRYDIWIDSPSELKRYFAIIGSHNPKHLKRYKS